jgi:hypothetical protein
MVVGQEGRYLYRGPVCRLGRRVLLEYVHCQFKHSQTLLTFCSMAVFHNHVQWLELRSPQVCTIQYPSTRVHLQ